MAFKQAIMKKGQIRRRLIRDRSFKELGDLLGDSLANPENDMSEHLFGAICLQCSELPGWQHHQFQCGQWTHHKIINFAKLLAESLKLPRVKLIKQGGKKRSAHPPCLVSISKFLDSWKINVHTRALVQSATLHYGGFVISWTMFKAELNHFKARQVWEKKAGRGSWGGGRKIYVLLKLLTMNRRCPTVQQVLAL